MQAAPAPGTTPPEHLIRIDRKTLAFMLFLLVALATATTFKLHGSSVGMWNTLLPGQEAQLGVIKGTPKKIRQDEWLGTTLQMISQAHSNPSYPVSNPAWGPPEIPLIANLPVRHWSMVFRPQYWGFFVLGLERGFSFYWAMKACFLLCGTFLLVMLLTENNFGIALLGSFWIFFSGFIQWWYSSSSMLPEMVGCVALLLVAIHYIALSTQPWKIAAGAFIFSACLLNSVVCFYPPFQVPLLYLGLAILIGSLGPKLPSIFKDRQFLFRLCALGAALLTVTGLGAIYYHDARQAIALARGTVYPGARMVSGGDLSLTQVFSGFYGVFMTQERYPDAWFNVCEASNFILLFPVPVAALLYGLRRKVKITALDASLTIYLLSVLIWITVGWPRAIAVASGFGLAWGPRSLLGLGLGSIFLCCTFLARERVDIPSKWQHKLLMVVAMLLTIAAYSRQFDRVTNHFAVRHEIVWVCLAGTAAAYCLLARQRLALAVCVLTPVIWSGGRVNPIAQGLDPILKAKPLSAVSQIIRQDPDARWAVFGPYLNADLLKAAGAQVINGTQLLPPLDDLRMLKASSADAYVYNRYAHVELAFSESAVPSFTLNANDDYTMAIDPGNVAWWRLGVRYVALPLEVQKGNFLKVAKLMADIPELNLRVYAYQPGDLQQDTLQGRKQ